MKSLKSLLVLVAFVCSLTLVSCDDDETNPNDFATQFEGEYSDAFGGTDKISITRTGDNQLTLSNSSGTALSADIVVTLSNEQTEEIDLFGILTKVTSYTSSNSDVEVSASTVSVLGQDVTTQNVVVTGTSGDFQGSKQ